MASDPTLGEAEVLEAALALARGLWRGDWGELGEAAVRDRLAWASKRQLEEQAVGAVEMGQAEAGLWFELGRALEEARVAEERRGKAVDYALSFRYALLEAQDAILAAREDLRAARAETRAERVRLRGRREALTRTRRACAEALDWLTHHGADGSIREDEPGFVALMVLLEDATTGRRLPRLRSR